MFHGRFTRFAWVLLTCLAFRATDANARLTAQNIYDDVTIFDYDKTALQPYLDEWKKCDELWAEQKKGCLVTVHDSSRSVEAILADTKHPMAKALSRLEDKFAALSDSAEMAEKEARRCDMDYSSRVSDYGAVRAGLPKIRERIFLTLDGIFEYAGTQMDSKDVNTCDAAMMKNNAGLLGRYIFTDNAEGHISKQWADLMDIPFTTFGRDGAGFDSESCRKRVDDAETKRNQSAVNLEIEIMHVLDDLNVADKLLEKQITVSQNQYRRCGSHPVSSILASAPSAKNESPSDITGTPDKESELTGTGASLLEHTHSTSPGKIASPIKSEAPASPSIAPSARGNGISSAAAASADGAARPESASPRTPSSSKAGSLHATPASASSAEPAENSQDTFQVSPEIRAALEKQNPGAGRTIFELVRARYKAKELEFR